MPRDPAGKDTPSPAGPKSAGDTGVTLVASDTQPVSGDAAWCAPLKICWDKLCDYHNGGQPLTPKDGPSDVVEALNNSPFHANMLSDDHYYSYAGPMTQEARSTIEEGIRQRFGQGSDLLDKLDWAGADERTTLFYAMLYREFSFEHPFALAPDAGVFGTSGEANVRYFGTIDSEDEERTSLLAQVQPLYYEDYEHCACRLTTKEGDVLVLVKGPEGKSFSQMWQNAMRKAGASGTQTPLKNDENFMCPLLSIDIFREYGELEGLKFDLSNGEELKIGQAMQTLKFDLDNKGGKVKSEAAISAVATSAPQEDERPRQFVFDDTFALFLVDGNAPEGSLPYLATLVSDAHTFQGA